MKYRLELEQDENGKWIADLIGHRVVAYGDTPDSATTKAVEILEELVGDTIEGLSWDIATDNLMKIERPTIHEVADRIREGAGIPLWILKSRVPTTEPVRYFETSIELYNYLLNRYCSDITQGESQ